MQKRFNISKNNIFNLRGTSTDVIHCLRIRELGLKVDCYPRRINFSTIDSQIDIEYIG